MAAISSALIHTNMRIGRPRELSAGQRQASGRTALPLILHSLMDEPFGALDPVTRAELPARIQTLARRLGKTIVFVTHDRVNAAPARFAHSLAPGGLHCRQCHAEGFLRLDTRSSRLHFIPFRFSGSTRMSPWTFILDHRGEILSATLDHVTSCHCHGHPILIGVPIGNLSMQRPALRTIASACHIFQTIPSLASVWLPYSIPFIAEFG